MGTIWGVEGSKGEQVKILNPLGLRTSGGSSNPENGKLTYRIYNIDNGKFFCELDYDKIMDIYNYFPEYQRKDKIKKIKKRIKEKINENIKS